MVSAQARLVRQLEAAERRLQELAHECLGEHEKARWRIEARGARTAARRRAERDAARETARWALFLARAELDAPGDFGKPRGPGQRPAAPPRLSLRDVAPHGRSRDDFARCARAAKDAVTRGAARGAAGGMLRAALRGARGGGAPSTDDDVAAALDGLSVTRCVRARGAAAAAARPAAAAYAFSGFPHAATPAALVDLLSAGARTRAVAERRRRGDGAPVRCVRCDAAPRPPFLSPTVLLNANAALWFLAGNPGAAFEDADENDADADPCAFALAGARVYYCLDERTMLPDDWNARAPPPAPEGNAPAETLVADGPGLRVAQDLAAAVAAAYLDGPLTEGAVSDPTRAAPRPAARYRGDHRRNATERARKALGRGAPPGEAAPTTAREAVDALADALASHPAVVETADGLHFGAASVAHLLEARHLPTTARERALTAAAAAAGGAREPRWGALHLYCHVAPPVALCNDGLGTPRGGRGAMRRLSARAVAVYADAFLRRVDVDERPAVLPSAVDVFPAPPDGRPEFFSLLATKAHGIAPPAEPRPGDKSPGGPASGEALLVAWTVDDAAPAAAAPPEPAAKLFQPADARIAPAACPPAPAKRRPAADDESSDDDVLGDVCQWRACVCARAPAPARNDDAPSPPGARRKKKKRAPRPLCAWHQALKAHLDAAAARANKPSDAARFLPRAATAKVKLIHAQLSKQGARAPAADYAEAAAIKGASPLLTELANGKLGATVRVFCRRAANESAERHGAAKKAAPKPPSAAGGARPAQSRRPTTAGSRRPATGDARRGARGDPADDGDADSDGAVGPGARRAEAADGGAAARLAADRRGAVDWAKWDDPEVLRNARRALAASLERLDKVAAAERAATRELSHRRESGDFPATALLSIRREHARLERERDELRDGGNDARDAPPDAAPARVRDEKLEVEFARRKLQLLKADRAAPHAGDGDARPSRPGSARAARAPAPDDDAPERDAAYDDDRRPPSGPGKARAGAKPAKARFVSPYATTASAARLPPRR